MRSEFGSIVETGRQKTGEFATQRGDKFGAFFLRCLSTSTVLKVIASNGSDTIKWEHVSVSAPQRTPTWEEMHWIKQQFWNDDECVMQLHPPESNYVNLHAHCLHLWKPLTQHIPLPPLSAV